jgi:hypothetical protein
VHLGLGGWRSRVWGRPPAVCSQEPTRLAGPQASATATCGPSLGRACGRRGDGRGTG